MVISLESQNVKIKKSIYKPQMRIPNIEFNISNPFKKLKNVTINNRYIPFIISLFIFSILFSRGSSLFIPTSKLKVDIKNITLPDHTADVISKDSIQIYESSVQDSLYTKALLHAGETLSTISIQYGVSRQTILQVNNIRDIKKIDTIAFLTVPPTDGYLHQLSARDTLDSLSLKYDVPIKDIFRLNNLKSENISHLDTIFIPGVDPLLQGWQSNLDRFFIYPVDGFISKRFGYHTNSITGITSLYQGLDLIPLEGDKVYASKSGYISRIGYSANYGKYIYIDHTGGSRTLYAHLDEVEISIRDSVKQGQVIGTVGNSGFTSRNKLFFSMFIKEEPINPELYLK
ncbi:MAG: peptidoglycan DD-metalloendopeptidase family protein [Spirochaetaceae bacterium]